MSDSQRPSAPSVDPYRGAHKAIRAALGRLLERAGRTDFGSAASTEAFRLELEAVVQLLTTHGRIEIQFIDPLLGLREVDIAKTIQHDHRQLEGQLHEVCGGLHAIDEVLAADGDVELARERGHAFYLALSRYVADYLVHMAEEEERALPALLRHADASALASTLERAKQTVDPVEWIRHQALLLTSVGHHERVEMLRANASPELRMVARVALTEQEWQKLSVELEEGDALTRARPP